MTVTRRASLTALPALGLAGAARADAPDRPALKLVVLDIGGTLVVDGGQVADTITATLGRHGIAVDPKELVEWRGASKPDIVHHFVGKQFHGSNAELMQTSKTIYDEFVRDLSKAYESAKPIPGALEAVAQLKAMGLTLASTTGFDRELAIEILHRLGFQAYLSAVIAGDDVTSGRPAPFMLFRAMEATRVEDVRTVLAVGDTPLDLQAAANGGIAGVGVFSGAATEDRLRKETSIAVLPSVAGLPELIRQGLPSKQCR